MSEFDQELDTSGLNCPMPVMKTKKALKGMDAGQVLHVIATDAGSAEDIPDLLDSTGDSMVETSQDGGTWHFYIKKA